MKEAELYAPIISGMMSEGLRAFKIADGSAGKKPFDICGTIAGGRALGVEVKATDAPSQGREAIGPDWTTFETHQIAWLRSFAKAGALALAVVYSKTDRVMNVWVVRHGNDMCKRDADYQLLRKDGLFVGWTALIESERKRTDD